MKNLNNTIQEFIKLEKVRRSTEFKSPKSEALSEVASDVLVSMSMINHFGLDSKQCEESVESLVNFCLTVPTANMANEVLSLFDSNPTHCPHSHEVFRRGIRFGLLNGVTPTIEYVRYSACDFNESLDSDFIESFEGLLFYKKVFNIIDAKTIEYAITNVKKKFVDSLKANEDAWREATASI